MHPLRLTDIGLLALLLAGCARAPGSPTVPGRPSPRTGDGRGVNAAAPIAFSYRPGTYVYVSHSEVSIALAGDTTRPPEQLTTDMVLTYQLLGDGRAPRVRGTVDSFSVAAGGRVRATAQALSAPLPFEGVVGGRVQLSGPRPDSVVACGAPNESLLAAAARTLVPLPSVLGAGDSWTDTLRTTVCRGDVSIATETVNRYTVEGPSRMDGVDGVRILRTSTLAISGSGSPRGRVVAITGTGSASGDLFFDAGGGRLLHSVLESTTNLTVDAAGRRQSLVQHERLRTTLRDATPGTR